MEIILLKDIDNLGDKHSIVKVKPGYGRNYLLPQKMAVIANEANKKKLDALIAEEEAKEAARVDEYKVLLAKLEGTTIPLKVKAGSTGKIFGSVNAIQVIQAIKEIHNIDIERKKITLPESIKELGTFEIMLNLHKDVKGTFNIELQQD